MIKLRHIAWTTGIGAGIVGLFSYFSNTSKTKEQLDSIISLQSFKLNHHALTLMLELSLKNQATSPLKIRYPQVKMNYNGRPIASSILLDKQMTILPKAQAQIKNMPLTIPLSGIQANGRLLLQELRNKSTIHFSAQTFSEINLGWIKLPYEKTETITLQLNQDNGSNKNK